MSMLLALFFVGCSTLPSATPVAVYGPANAPISLRVGNGGAGPTGLLQALVEDYLAFSGGNFAVAYHQDITRITLDKLRQGRIDVGLSYEAFRDAAAEADGWAEAAVPIFYDHFVLVGPQHDPAAAAGLEVTLAFARLWQLANTAPNVPLFLSRDDASGTNARERALWARADATPDGDWYVRHRTFPAPALHHAAEAGLYTLTDRGTYLATAKTRSQVKVLLQGGPALLNPCSAVMRRDASAWARSFVAYLTSPRGQRVVADYGRERFGLPLFTPAAQPDFLPADALP